MSAKRERHQQLVADRNSKSEQLEALRADRSKALIEGSTFERTAELLALESDVGALDQAVATADQLAEAEEARDLAADTANHLHARDEAIGKASDKYAAAVAAAEKGIGMVVEALLIADEVGAHIQRLGGPYNYQIGVEGSKPAEIRAVGSVGMRNRLSDRLQRALSPLSPGNGVYGQIQWAAQQVQDSEPWGDEERTLLERDVAQCRRTIAAKIEELEAAARAE
jgi:hypothetical protein